jgi:hypothetical protein
MPFKMEGEERMVCRNCGNEIGNDAKFCTKCGAQVQNSQETMQNPSITVNSDQTASDNNRPENKFEEIKNQLNFKDKTNYAGTSFWCSIAGIPLICCCGVGLAMGIPATLFGALALRNKEADRAKAWIGVILGVIEIIGLLIFIWAYIRDEMTN